MSCYTILGKIWKCIANDSNTHYEDSGKGTHLIEVGAFSMVKIMSMRTEAPEQQRAFYKSKAWQRCRSAYIASVGGLCERCLARGYFVPGYIVHHKEYIDTNNITDPSVLFSFENLEYLCEKCHNQEHFGEKKRYVIRADGSVVAAGPP